MDAYRASKKSLARRRAKDMGKDKEIQEKEDLDGGRTTGRSGGRKGEEQRITCSRQQRTLTGGIDRRRMYRVRKAKTGERLLVEEVLADDCVIWVLVC